MKELWDGEVVEPEHALSKLVGRLGAVIFGCGKPESSPSRSEGTWSSPRSAAPSADLPTDLREP